MEQTPLLRRRCPKWAPAESTGADPHVSTDAAGARRRPLAKIPWLHADAGSNPEVRNVDVARLDAGSLGLARIAAAAAAGFVATPVGQGEFFLSLTDLSQQPRQVGQMLGDEMDDIALSASADSIPILCITGQAPRAKLYKEDFQAVDIESIAKPVTKWAVTVREPALVPMVFQQAFHVMRSGRPGPVLIDLPVDVQMAEIEFDDEVYAPLPVYKPSATRPQIEKALAMLDAAERPLIVAGGGIINADASDALVRFAELTGIPVIPTLMGWGAIPDDHPLMAGMVGLQTSHRYGNRTFLASDFLDRAERVLDGRAP